MARLKEKERQEESMLDRRTEMSMERRVEPVSIQRRVEPRPKLIEPKTQNNTLSKIKNKQKQIQLINKIGLEQFPKYNEYLSKKP